MVSCGDKFTMLVVEPCVDAAEFQRNLRSSAAEVAGPSKVSVRSTSMLGKCLSLAHIHRVVDSTILCPQKPFLSRAANSLTVSRFILDDYCIILYNKAGLGLE